MSRLARLRRSSLFELIFVGVTALFLALAVQAYAVKPYQIPSGSMEPTLRIGDRVLVDRAGHRLGAQPEVGDIVVFHPPAGADEEPAVCGAAVAGAPCDKPTDDQSDQTFIKRVVAVGGDTVAIHDGHVTRNGKLAAEPFAADCGGVDGCDYAQPIKIPEGYVFVMGDNRGASLDSRFWGPVPVSWVIGQARASYWPPSHVGTL